MSTHQQEENAMSDFPDLDRLERLADEAEAESEGNLARAMTATGVETWEFRDEAHEALRTAFSNPQTVLALLRRIRELEECKKRLRERLKWPYKDDYLGTHADGFGDDPCEVGS